MQRARFTVSTVAKEICLHEPFGKEFQIATETGLAGGKEFVVHLRVIEAGHRSAIEMRRARWRARRQFRCKGPQKNKVYILAADASRRAALLVAYRLPVCALLTPCRAGASTPRMHTLCFYRP